MKDDQDGNDDNAATSFSSHEAIAATTAKLGVSKKRKRNRDDDQDDHYAADAGSTVMSRIDGCSCRGSCLTHSCSCLVQGRFCDPSNCACCNSDTSMISVESAVTTTSTTANITCQNNNRQEIYVERRKEALLTAMQDYPELFWANKNNKVDPNNALMTEHMNSILILESTDTQQETVAADAGHSTTTAKNISRDVDTAMWVSVQKLLNEKSTSSDISNVRPPSRSATYRLHRIQTYLDGLLQEPVLVDEDRMKVGNDSRTDEDLAAASKDVANKLVQATAKDLLHIIQLMINETARNSVNHDGKNFTDFHVNATTGDLSKDDNKEYPKIEERPLLCSEDFPEEQESSQNDDDDKSINYFEKLETRSASFANAGNSNDPLVRNLICEEKGFFEGDDTLVLEEGVITNEAEQDVQQHLLLVQETTQMIRAKTLELARQRLN